MKILDLQIQGFRSLYNIVWKPGDLNIVIGPNGSGKSNLLKALEMLSQSANGKLGQQMSCEGGMDSVVCKDPNGAISFKLTGNGLNNNGSNGAHNNLTYQLDLSQIDSSSNYKIDYEILGGLPQSDHRFKPWPEIALERYVNSGILYDEEHRRHLISQEMMTQEESVLSSISSLFSTNKNISLYQRWLSHWQIYHDFQTHRDAVVRQAAFVKMENALVFDGSNLVQVLHTLYENNPDFNNHLNNALQAAFGKDFDSLSFPTVGNQKILFQINWKSFKRPQTSAMLSDGALRFIYLMTILANPNLAPLIAINEPETGLHASMMPIIAEYVRSASRRTQIIITTHSEDFLNTLSDNKPTVTIVKIKEGKTYLDALEGESLRYWMKDCVFHNA
jgi:predicted ATPase